jgi:hypothetical protein
MLQKFLNVQALPYFENHLMRRLEEEDTKLPDYELIELVL